MCCGRVSRVLSARELCCVGGMGEWVGMDGGVLGRVDASCAELLSKLSGVSVQHAREVLLCALGACCVVI